MIINQLKRLGGSCDWSRERFTMDEGLSRAVREVFVRLYEEGLIYRGRLHHQLVPALPDRPLRPGGGARGDRPAISITSAIRWSTGEGFVTVATTRPETMLGDTAVAVNPEDARYKHLHRQQLCSSPAGPRRSPIIADDYVDREFGTGAL